jgi:Domain of unknown function (DUF4296)
MGKNHKIECSVIAMKLKQDFSQPIIGLVFCFAIFYSCSSKRDRPPGILSQEEMAKALTEFYLKDAKITTLRLEPDSSLSMFQLFKQRYAEENNFSDSLLEESYQYYLGNPSELSEIYDRIIDTLALAEQRSGVVLKRAE